MLAKSVLSPYYDVSFLGKDYEGYFELNSGAFLFIRYLKIKKQIKAMRDTPPEFIILDDLTDAVVLTFVKEYLPETKTAVIVSSESINVLTQDDMVSSFYEKLYRKVFDKASPDLFICLSPECQREAARIGLVPAAILETVPYMKIEAAGIYGDNNTLMFPNAPQYESGAEAIINGLLHRIPDRMQYVCSGIKNRYRPSKGILSETLVYWIDKSLSEHEMLTTIVSGKAGIIPPQDNLVADCNPFLANAQISGAVLLMANTAGHGASVIPHDNIILLDPNNMEEWVDAVNEISRWSNVKRRQNMNDINHIENAYKERRDSNREIFRYLVNPSSKAPENILFDFDEEESPLDTRESEKDSDNSNQES